MPRLLTEYWTIAWTSRFRLFYALPVLVMSSLQRLRSATKGGSAQVCKHVTWHKYSYGSSQKAAQVFAPAGFDMEIVEKHHNLKLDAPSGTALALADSINEAMDNEYHYVYDRSQRREKRDARKLVFLLSEEEASSVSTRYFSVDRMR